MNYRDILILIVELVFTGLVQNVWATEKGTVVQPVLTINYDQDFNGIGHNGHPVSGTLVGNPILAPGKFGQALKSGPTTGYVEYPSQGILNTQSGTVEMWASPVDWSSGFNDSDFHHVFFEARGQGALYLYKYSVMSQLLMQAMSYQGGPEAVSHAPIYPLQFSRMDMNWVSGQWYHIAGTWSPQGVLVYVNGKSFPGIPPTRVDLPRGDLLPFRIGDHPWHTKRITSTLIDNVRIYDRALSSAHIAAHYAGDYNFTLPLAIETSRLDFQINPDAKTVLVCIDIGAANIEDDRLQIKYAIVPKGQTLPDNATSLTFSNGLGTGVLPVPSPGEYAVIARLLLDGKELFELHTDMTIPTTEWLGNKLGLEDKVLPPWTPMKVQGTAVSCWGRKYRFGDGALPTQIASAGKDMLTRPVFFRATLDGKQLFLNMDKPHLDSSSPTRVKVSSRFVAGTAKFSTRVTMEYDGLALFEITADQQPDKMPFDSLSMEIPVKAEHALYRHRYQSNEQEHLPPSGNVPEGEGVVEKTPWLPFAWLGDNDRGIFWFCETDEMWPNRTAENAVEIVRSGQEVALRLNILSLGQKLPPSWKFIFGLHATPVKPIPRDWRKWRLEGYKKTVSILWPAPNSPSSLRAFGYPEAADSQVYTEYVNGFHDRGEKSVPYVGLTFLTEGMPETDYFRKKWDMGANDPYVSGGNFKPWYMVSPVGKGFSDFVIWKTKEFIERYNLDGVYHDQTHPYQSNRMESGVGYERDGVRYRTYPILGYRDLYRRNYAVLKSLPRETFSMAHMSGKMTIPVLAYEDAYLDGEHLASLLTNSSYMEVLTLDMFRAEYMGRQWGLMPVFLPEFRNPEMCNAVEPTREMMGLLMVHDVSLWLLWANGKVINEAYRSLDKFGYVDSDFIPYFDPTPPATTDMENVYISAYKRADGRALLIVANLSKKPKDQQGKVWINAKRIGLPLNKVVNWPDEQPLNVIKGAVQIEVPKQGYRMIMVSR
ncbi:MAG: glycoside hydrolase domain-containing protein [Candidatus Omnitrophota bacterium]